LLGKFDNLISFLVYIILCSQPINKYQRFSQTRIVILADISEGDL
jgi:hypothetical protein